MRDKSSWMLDRNIFLLINATFGPLNVDLFADRTNNQLDVYMSWFPDPGAVATNAFLHPWMGENAYAFPPFCLIGQCIAKLRAEKCEIVLVTPGWQTQAWYPHLMSMSIQNPLLLPTTDNLFDVSDRGRSPIGVQRDSHSNRMEAIGGRFEAIGLSENVKNLLFGSCRDGTNRSYESAWNKWVSWCCEREITPISASLSQFLEYLSWMYENKYEYRTINVHRSAISSVLPPLDGAPIGQNFLSFKINERHLQQNSTST